ncbi:putative membrane protein [Acinetobacter proteolyticus]|jgi:tetratricopeptide (TPR) repeat protein|uniref:Putative membrane protein n=1 Tax=Acinetobacter proteolyticus TaxID=1776741 RepID=A0A653K7L2_9GAMM|nr:tetratricopeptide repeat protein [Acinetobacter proteolyticus]VXA56621.1 putative membrane protein [Acinetobacter proteolyticus]
MIKKNLPVVYLYSILVVCYFIYLVGLEGDFLFDDFPNLQDLGNYGTIDSWDKVQNFISNGFSGPTGRPISLASFLLNDNTWPSFAYSFKYTNLMIHLLNGVLLYWATLLLLRTYHYKEQHSLWIAFVSSAIWLLHPYFVSTTLYVVQRMAQLATLFSLIGIIGYLRGRILLSKKNIFAYIWMTFSIAIGTILATYSKENGALLPLLILVIEFCNPRKENKPIWQWRAVCLWLPSIAITLLLIKYMSFSEHPWPNRNFNMIERLYSEARIVTEYLFNLFIPQIELKGLYQDGFNISRSLTQPITTLYSIIFLCTLIVSAFFVKRNYPLFALAALFFFAAHLMESTVLGLELYFEHRNYLAAIFLFLPVASGLYALQEKVEPRLVYIITILILSILSFFTYERAKLWGDTSQLLLYWAKNSPDSPRAQSELARNLLDQGKVLESNQFLEKTIDRLPNSPLLTIQLLLQKVSYGLAKERDFTQTTDRLIIQPFDAQAIQGLRVLTDGIINSQYLCSMYCSLTLGLITNLEQDAKYNKVSVFWRLTPYLKAKIYLAMKEDTKALNTYIEAVRRYKDVEAGLMMVAEIGSNSSASNALILLNEVEKIYHRQDISTLRRSKQEYDVEIPRLKKVLQLETNNARN